MPRRLGPNLARQLHHAGLAAIAVAAGGIITLGIHAVPLAGVALFAGVIFIPSVRKELRPIPALVTTAAALTISTGAFLRGRTLTAVTLIAVGLGGGLLMNLTRGSQRDARLTTLGGNHGRMG